MIPSDRIWTSSALFTSHKISTEPLEKHVSNVLINKDIDQLGIKNNNPENKGVFCKRKSRDFEKMVFVRCLDPWPSKCYTFKIK